MEDKDLKRPRKGKGKEEKVQDNRWNNGTKRGKQEWNSRPQQVQQLGIRINNKFVALEGDKEMLDNQ